MHDTAHVIKTGLCRTEIENKIKQDGQVVSIIGNVEVHNLLLFAVLLGYQGYTETVILLSFIGFGAFLSTVDKMLLLDALARRHRERKARSGLQ